MKNRKEFMGFDCCAGSQTNKRNTSQKSIAPQSTAKNYSVVFPAFFALAHLALAAAERAALPAALNFLLAF
jgi:hypothetical protein